MHNMKVTLHEETSKLVIEVDLNHEGRQTGRGNTIIAGTSNWEKLDEIQPGLSINMALVQSSRVRR